MKTLTTQATRRAIFGTIGLGVAAATVTAAAPIGALTTPARAGVSPDLARLIFEADRADTTSERFQNEVYRPARAASGHNLAALRDESDRLDDRLVDTIDAVIAFPCRSIADLNAKMAKVMEWDALANEGTGIMIAADVARLAREA